MSWNTLNTTPPIGWKGNGERILLSMTDRPHEPKIGRLQRDSSVAGCAVVRA